MSRLNVFDYDNYLSFIKDLYFFELKQNPNLTLLDLAKIYGYKSHSSLQLIFAGKRLPTQKYIDQIALRHKLKRGETIYLLNLIKLAQEPKLVDDKAFAAEMSRIKPLSKYPLTKIVEEYDFIVNGLFPICLEMCNLKNFKIENVANRLLGGFSADTITHIYKRLEVLGYMKDGKPVNRNNIIPEEIKDDLVYAIYEGSIWFKKLLLHLDENSDPRDPNIFQEGFVMALNEEDLADINAYIISKMKTFINKFEASDGTSNYLSYVYFGHTRLNKK